MPRLARRATQVLAVCGLALTVGGIAHHEPAIARWFGSTWRTAEQTCSELSRTGSKLLTLARHQVALARLPAPVVWAARNKFPSARLISVDLETEGGRDVYEVTACAGCRYFDLTITARGEVIEIEDRISSCELPRAVVAAVNSRYPGVVVVRAEKVRRGGGPAVYELRAVTAGGTIVSTTYDPRGAELSNY